VKLIVAMGSSKFAFTTRITEDELHNVPRGTSIAINRPEVTIYPLLKTDTRKNPPVSYRRCSIPQSSETLHLRRRLGSNC
jgi:hypothetical protein